MLSKKCIMIALIGSVMLTAVLAVETPDVAADDAAALEGELNSIQGAQMNAKTTIKTRGMRSSLGRFVEATGEPILVCDPCIEDVDDEAEAYATASAYNDGEGTQGDRAVGSDAVGDDAFGQDAVGGDAVGQDAFGPNAVGGTAYSGNADGDNALDGSGTGGRAGVVIAGEGGDVIIGKEGTISIVGGRDGISILGGTDGISIVGDGGAYATGGSGTDLVGDGDVDLNKK